MQLPKLSVLYAFLKRTPTLPTEHIFLPWKALLRPNVAERRTWKREAQLKNADLTNFFIIIIKIVLPNQISEKNVLVIY